MEEPKEKAYVAIHHWDETVKIEFNHHDLAIKEVAEAFERVLLGAGFSEKMIEEYYGNK